MARGGAWSSQTNFSFALFAIFTSVSMTGTSVSTPTVVARAASYGTSDKAVSTWENGRRGPKLKTIETLAKQFDVPIDVMVNGNLEDYYNKPSSRSQSNIQEAQDYLLKLIDFQGDKSSLTYEYMLFLKKKSPNKYNKGRNLGSRPSLVSLQNHIDRNEKSEHIFCLNKMVRISLVWWKLTGSNR